MPANNFGEFFNRNIFARADIEKAEIGIVLHHKYAGVCRVIGIDEFAPRRAGSPDCHTGALASLAS